MASYKKDGLPVTFLLMLLNYAGYVDACLCALFDFDVFCCPDGIYCCPNGYFCSGSSCISIILVVVPIVGGVGLICLIVGIVYVVKKRRDRQQGIVMQTPLVQPEVYYPPPEVYPPAQYPPPGTGYPQQESIPPQYRPAATEGETPKSTQ